METSKSAKKLLANQEIQKSSTFKENWMRQKKETWQLLVL